MELEPLLLTETNNYKILGINFRDTKLSKSILAVTFNKECESLGISTINYLNQNLAKYDFGILYPAGFDHNSIEYVIENSKEMPLLVLLDSLTYYRIFTDDSYGKVQEF